MKITYFVSAGVGDATRASIPLHLAANGSVEVGQETSIILGGDAAELLLGDNLQTPDPSWRLRQVLPQRHCRGRCGNTRLRFA